MYVGLNASTLDQLHNDYNIRIIQESKLIKTYILSVPVIYTKKASDTSGTQRCSQKYTEYINVNIKIIKAITAIGTLLERPRELHIIRSSSYMLIEPQLGIPSHAQLESMQTRCPDTWHSSWVSLHPASSVSNVSAFVIIIVIPCN